MIVGELQPFGIVVRTNDRKHRSKDLFFINAHRWLDLVEQASAHIEAVLIALHLEGASVYDELGAFLDADVDVVLYFLEVGFGDQWPKVGLLVGRGSNLEIFHAADELGNEGICSGLADWHSN